MATDGTSNQTAASTLASSKITKKQWLIWASAFATVLVITYTLLHWALYDNHGEKTHRLSTTEFAAVTSIVQTHFTNPPAAVVPTTTPTDSTSQADSTVQTSSNVQVTPTASDSLVKQRVKDYLNDIMVLKNQKAVYAMIDEQGVTNITYLSNYPFKVQSYFWLSDYWVLLEVIFWSLFGLVANLMFIVTRTREPGTDGSGSTTKPEVFDPNRIPEHVGKFWYTPLTSVVIYLSIDYLTASGEIQETPEGAYVIVFAFILGFFSRRTIALLRKLKDIFFPNDGMGSNSNSDDNSGAATDPDPSQDPDPNQDPSAEPEVNPDPNPDATADPNSDVNGAPDANPDSNSDSGSATDPSTQPQTNTANTDATPATNQPAAPINQVTINGTVEADASLGLKSFVGTVINLYAAANPDTALQTVTLASGTDGTFSFANPVEEGAYTYDATKTLSKASYTANGNLTVTGATATQELTITLTASAG